MAAPSPLYTLRFPDMGPVFSLCIDRNVRLLAGNEKGNICIWDLRTHRINKTFKVGSAPVTSLHHVKDTLIVQEKGGNITTWLLCSTGYLKQHTIEENYMGFCRSALLGNIDDPSDAMIFYPSENDIVSYIKVKGIKELTPQRLVPSDMEHNGNPMPKLGMLCCLKPLNIFGKVYVLVGYESGNIIIWDVDNVHILAVKQLHAEPICIDYEPYTKRGIIAGTSNEITMFTWDYHTMELKVLKTAQIVNPGVNCIKIRNDLKVVTCCCWDGRIRIFSWRSLKPLAVLIEHKGYSVMDIVYSTGEVKPFKAPIAVVAGTDGHISLWNLFN